MVLTRIPEGVNRLVFTTAQLHAEIAKLYYRNETTITSIHVRLPAAIVIRGNIVLTPHRNGSIAIPPYVTMLRPLGPSKLQPKILQYLPKRLEDAAFGDRRYHDYMEQFFPGVSSYSLVSMPVEVWSVLRGITAYVFIRVVYSSGLTHGIGDIL